MGDFVFDRGSLERGAASLGIDAQESYEDRIAGRRRYDSAEAPAFSSSVRVERIAGDGEANGVTIDGLLAGEQRLEAGGADEVGRSGGRRLVVDPIALSEFEVADLGLVPLTRGATRPGRAIFPDGVDPTAIELRAESWGRSSRARRTADGSFRLVGIPPGRVRLSCGDAPDGVASNWTQVVEVSAGPNRAVELDLTQ